MTPLRQLLTLLAATLLLTSAYADYDPTTPLYLNAYLATPELREQGRNLSLVPAFPMDPNNSTLTPLPFPFHSGYLQAAQDCHFYFQLLSPANASSPSPVPLIVFLAGGPGIAGSYWTLMGGVTPLMYVTTTGLPQMFVFTNQSWALDSHVLVIDFPATVGFSHCTSEQPSPANVSAVTVQLLSFMSEFFVLFPELGRTEVFIAGHSFGARHAADVAAGMQRARLPVSGCVMESGMQGLVSFSEICSMVYQQGRMARSQFTACQSSFSAGVAAVAAKNAQAAYVAGVALMGAVTVANDGYSYFDFQRAFRAQPNPFSSNTLRLALHTGYGRTYNSQGSVAYSDAYTGESVTSLDEVLTDGGRSRVLYMADDTDQLHGASTQRMLSTLTYTSRTNWGNRTRSEPLRIGSQLDTRGFVKRDERLWFAMVYNTGHAMSVVQPDATRQLIRDFIRAGRGEDMSLPARTALVPQNSPSRAAMLLPKGAGKPRIPAAGPDQPVVSPAVYLTQYVGLADGARLAQQASTVTLPSQSVLSANGSYAGYITIDPDVGSNTFFWLVRSLDGNASAPLILHLSGGPGFSSIAMGMMYQHGPLELIPGSSDPLAVRRRNNSYAEHCHVLYVDSPVGTGYSYTSDPRGIRTDSRQVADDLFEFLRQFYLLFPLYTNNRLYLHGVSYAGHFLPALGAKIHRENQRRSVRERLPLEGLFIASGWMDEESQTRDESQFFASIGRADLFHPSDIIGCDGSSCDLDWWNYVFPNDWEQQEPLIMAYLIHPAVVSALHTGARGLSMQAFNATVNAALQRDPSVKPEVEELLASGSYRLALYTAEYDVVCAASGVLSFVASLNYVNVSQWETRTSKVWQQPVDGGSPTRQPPHSTWPYPLFPPQPNAIWWQSQADLTLSYAVIRFAGHLIERTHLYQAGLVLSRIMALPTLPKQQLQASSSSSTAPASLSSSTGSSAQRPSAPTSAPMPQTSSTPAPMPPTAAPTASQSSSSSSSSLVPPPPPPGSSSTGGEAVPEEGESNKGVIISAVLLASICAFIGAGAALQIRKERREKEEREHEQRAERASHRSSLHASLLRDDARERRYGNSVL